VFGPFLGVALSLFSMQNTQVAATSTLMALTPVVIIVPSVLILKQKIHYLEILGAAIAVGGAALFFCCSGTKHGLFHFCIPHFNYT